MKKIPKGKNQVKKPLFYIKISERGLTGNIRKEVRYLIFETARP
jgi:hypothetical protein